MNLLEERTQMTASRTQYFSELISGHDGPEIPEAKRAYFRSRLRNRVFNFILEKFVAEQENGLTKAALARRIGKTPDIVNRWLGAPSNLTIDTMSDLLLGISAEEFELESSSPVQQPMTNYSNAPWIKNENQVEPQPTVQPQPTAWNPMAQPQRHYPGIPRELQASK